MSAIERVGVVGSGLMGSGIAEVSARTAHDVVVVESSEDLAKAGLARLEGSLHRAEERGKLEEPAADVLARIRVVTDLDALADRDVVVEAIVEDEAAKVELFRQLDAIVTAPEAILASNTSSIPIMKLGVVTSRPTQVVGVHFFNPVPVLQLVELVPSLITSPETTERARTWVQEGLGKQAIDCQDRAGFVVNALLIPVHPLGDPDVRVRLRLRRGHRPRPGARSRPPAGPARARRPDRPGHHQGRG